MKVKTFTGTHREALDSHINDWLAQSNVEVRKTSIAFKALRDKGRDAVMAGRLSAERSLSPLLFGTMSPAAKHWGQVRPLGFSAATNRTAARTQDFPKLHGAR
jgi:hypothetical protein